MSRLPSDNKSPKAESSHYSGRRNERRNSNQNRDANADLAENEPIVDGGIPQNSRSVPEQERNPTANNSRPGQNRMPRSNGRNWRPGRRKSADARQIEFPPKPNRQHSGIARRPTKQRNGARLANAATHQRTSRTNSPNNAPLYAALDLGTNNCRLLVALPQQAGRFRVVDGFSRIVRLGKGLESSGRLDEDAMDRAIAALGECARKLKNTNIRKMRLIATEACRRAENGEHFIKRVKQETGLDLSIVNQETEAKLAAEGCGELVDRKADGVVLFDIGGGSSELVLLDRRGRKKAKVSEQISAWASLPVGVVTLSERHGGQQVTPEIFDAMIADVESHLAEFEGRNNLRDFWSDGRVHLLGTSGTVTTLAGVHLELPRYDRRQVDGIWLEDAQVDNVINRLVDMDFKQRAANACIGEERADLVLAGCAILQAIRNRWPSPRLRVADRGLREGLLTQMMDLDGAWVKPKNGRNNFGGRKRGQGGKPARARNS